MQGQQDLLISCSSASLALPLPPKLVLLFSQSASPASLLLFSQSCSCLRPLALLSSQPCKPCPSCMSTSPWLVLLSSQPCKAARFSQSCSSPTSASLALQPGMNGKTGWLARLAWGLYAWLALLRLASLAYPA